MNKKALLAQVEKNVLTCRKCRLCEHAKNAVPGEGNIDSEIVFIGEAPGATEDATGRPFVGRAGKLLEDLLAQVGYKREDVWIGNIIKHRPPENRDPLPDEIAACQPYLKVQLEAIAPKLIITLGRFAMNYFYADGKISRDHGTLRRSTDGKYIIFPVYHPAAALRNGDMAAVLKSDFLKIPEMLQYVRKGEGDKLSSKETSAQDGQLDLF